MVDLEKQAPPKKKKTWQIILILVVLGLAVNFILPQFTDFRASIEVVKDMTWWAVALAVVAEMLSYLSYGYCLHAIFSLHQHKISMFTGAMIAMASSSIGLVAGGWVAASAATYGFARKRGADQASSSMAGILPSMLINSVIFFVAIAGIVFLAFTHQLTQTQLIQYTIFLALLLIFTYGYLAALYYPKTTFKVVNWALWNWANIRRKPYSPTVTKESIQRFTSAWKTLRDGRWVRPLIGASAYILFDMACLYFTFVAAGHSVNLGVLAAGYGLPLLLAKMAFIVPGGVGVVEASMAALITGMGVDKGISTVVTIGYRLLSFWLPTLMGFGLGGILGRKNGTNGNGSNGGEPMTTETVVETETAA